MTLLRVSWLVTEEHEALIDVEGYDGDEDSIDDSLIAEHEGDDSYRSTPDREVTSVVVVQPEIDLRSPCPDCKAPLDVTPDGERCTSCSYAA